MKARRLIESSTYEPNTLAVLFQAFDEGWEELARDYDGDAKAVEAARMRLAHAVLVVAREDTSDPERLKREALQVMALAYR